MTDIGRQAGRQAGRQGDPLMSGRFASALAELRQQRGLIDQAIVALEILDGERSLPAAPGEAYTAVAVPPARRALPPAPSKPRRKYKGKTAAKKEKAPRAVGVAGPLLKVANDDQAVLHAVRELGSAAKAEVMKRTKLTAQRVNRAKGRLQANGELVVKGRARAARWSLPAAKEAP